MTDERKPEDEQLDEKIEDLDADESADKVRGGRAKGGDPEDGGEYTLKIH